MKSGKSLALFICLILVLGLTFIIAAENGTMNKTNKSMESFRRSNYSNCMFNQTMIKNSCYRTKKVEYKTCERETRKFFREQRFNHNSTMNRTELIKVTMQKDKTCRENYKVGLKDCRNAFNISMQKCEVFRNQSNHTHIEFNRTNENRTPPAYNHTPPTYNHTTPPYTPPHNNTYNTSGNCTCPAGYRKEGDACNPECYYSTPPCLMPSISCQSHRIIRVTLNATTCASAGGRWNECGSRCTINSQGKEGIACPALCEALCECGTIAGLTCPSGYICRTPAGVTNATGYCM